jgi:hypothetical protein
MSCRAGALRYDRPFTEAFIRPGLEPERWGNRANYAAWNVVPTGPTEMSIYVSDRRYALRTDGFASVRAGAGGGELLTRVVCCPGGELVVNLSTSAAGSLRVELRSAENRPIPGYRLTDCPAIVGDQIERLVSWNRGADLSRLAGRPVRLRMVLADADLYGLRFRLPA